MKRTSFAIIFACFALALVAQDAIKVKYQGAKPTISDFVWAYLSAYGEDDDDGCMNEPLVAVKEAWVKKQNGRKLDKGETLTIDKKNGYVRYESKHEVSMLRVEMCYWNESDGKHKLFAYNVSSFVNGKYEPGQFDNIIFYRYNNATKKMTMYSVPGFDSVYDKVGDGNCLYFDLPRTGKNITANFMNYASKKTTPKTLKWTGSKFKF
ncbi:MAG: hypothetical protein IKW83_10350 [Muribaculaceae bacterium]|nr:hypothetical protein [Muribaculaceae bacterium]